MERQSRSTGGTPLASLFESLSARRRPEDVAEIVREALGSTLTRSELRTLEKAARGSLKRRLFGYTSMLETFAKPVGLERQVRTACELFSTAYPLAGDLASNPTAVADFIRDVGREIRKEYGLSDFKRDRLSAKVRKAAGVELSRRKYNKRFRLLARMEARLVRLIREIRKRGFQMAAKSALASKLSWDDFRNDLDSACFIAYFVATSNRRSEFTIGGQKRPFDDIAAMLFERCTRRPDGTNWWAIAHVFPHQDVLVRLTPHQVGVLLGTWHAMLEDVADMLEEVWPTLGVNPRGMVVGRGMDSSTWNTTAGAWNKARDHWIALLYSLGLDEVLDAQCPGKVMRLMAADVVAWHGLVGNTLDPNTVVWAELPRPWDVVAGREPCTRTMVVAACRNAGLDPAKTGWTAPRSYDRVATFERTPELVHGVTVASPHLAKLMRQMGYFSGKPKRFA